MNGATIPTGRQRVSVAEIATASGLHEQTVRKRLALQSGRGNRIKIHVEDAQRLFGVKLGYLAEQAVSPTAPTEPTFCDRVRLLLCALLDRHDAPDDGTVEALVRGIHRLEEAEGEVQP